MCALEQKRETEKEREREREREGGSFPIISSVKNERVNSRRAIIRGAPRRVTRRLRVCN